MRSLPRAWLIPLAALCSLLLTGDERLSAADDKDNIESKRVHFPTFDEVELSGTFYRSMPSSGKKDKDAVVLLLHDFRHDKGGSSQEDGWRPLAGRLQREGYAVLSFDFRGFGGSKSVSPKFWKFAHNQRLRGAGRSAPPASIDQKSFSAGYYITLVNDIAAARAYLDVLNDAGDVNSSNILIVGAGQGAALGALWMASECRRQKDPTSDRVMEGRLPDWTNPFKSFSQPEGDDLGAAVWLTISPKLETRLLGAPLKSAIVDTAKNAKISTCFLYSKKDDDAMRLTKGFLTALGTDGKKTDQKGIKEKAIVGAGDLSGSKLLSGRLKTTDNIVEFLNSVVEDRGTRTRRTRDSQKYAYCWSIPWPTARNVRRVLAKLPGEALPHLIPDNVLVNGR